MREKYLKALVEARMSRIAILEDLSVRAIDVKLEILEARGGEVLQIGDRSQAVGVGQRLRGYRRWRSDDGRSSDSCHLLGALVAVVENRRFGRRLVRRRRRRHSRWRFEKCGS